MRFSVTSAVTIVTGLTASGSAFMIDTFDRQDCDGPVQSGVNILDNACAAWAEGFRSFKITGRGGNHQRAHFFAADNCGSLTGAIRSGYVDSTAHGFKIGECYDFHGATANVIASYYG
ncbi:uncharacterized protein EI97DRAFT_444196 [Westerdykella ornata]|uniref:Uncharacterized protein n=1 Tax=Westerdykella ornata TaxID=318751 RepID=A0A6A6JC36_WESOR|nr:uncharacterized protein EI97DRAFT_444196 [Westerdykella ornata]KAF2274180.1 hypothetical protein EI97DRAFT_444196 [Westerdykella ornata]